MILNLDIWREIMDYFEPSQKFVPPTLRALAVTSRSLSPLALDVIWRSGRRISTLVSVINSFAHSPNEPFLEYLELVESDDESGHDDNSVGTWVSSSQLPSFVFRNSTQFQQGIE